MNKAAREGMLEGMLMDVTLFWKRVGTEEHRERIGAATVWIVVTMVLVALVGIGPWLLNRLSFLVTGF